MGSASGASALIEERSVATGSHCSSRWRYEQKCGSLVYDESTVSVQWLEVETGFPLHLPAVRCRGEIYDPHCLPSPALHVQASNMQQKALCT